MNLLYAEVIEVFPEDGMRFGKVRVGGAMRATSLALLRDIQPGDRILLCDGVAIGKVENETSTENTDVSGHPR